MDMDTAKPPETDDALALQDLLRERTAEIVMLTRELVRVQDALAAAQADLLRDRSVITAIASEPESPRFPSEGDWNDAQPEIDALRARLEAADRHIQDLYQSTSWRVSAPLRALSRAIRRR